MTRWPARIGRWNIRGAIGAGGTAEILLGVDDAGGEAAIKRPPIERADDPIAVDRVRAEARLLAQVAHPNVVRFIELVEGAPPSLVMERLNGRALADVELVADPALALRVGLDGAAALAAVHAATDAGGPLHAVHRDVSPDNLFVGDVVKLFDFNVAFYRGREQAPAPGALQGRIAYMAPEQARSETVDGRADVFALGVVVWERLTGARLMWRGNTLATLRAVIDDPIPRASERIELPAALDALVAEMLERDPRKRPAAAEVASRLRTLVETGVLR